MNARYIIIVIHILSVFKFFAQSLEDELCVACKCNTSSGTMVVECINVTHVHLHFPQNLNAISLTIHNAKWTDSMYQNNLNRALNYANITKLSLDLNELTKLKSMMFNRLHKLNSLSLNKNNIITIQNEAFHGVNDLEYLSLSHNNLTKIGREILLLSNIKYLNFSFNEIEAIDLPPESFTKLKTLDLSHNNLVFIKNFNFAPNLLSINLSLNVIEEIRNNSFSKLKMLEELYLTNNKINNTYFLSYSVFPKLKILNIEKNFLSFANIPVSESLTNLNLNHNNISSLKLTHENSILEVLNVRNNSLKNSNFINELEKLKELDVSLNNVELFPNFLPRSLKNLNMSYNIINDFPGKKPPNSGSVILLDLSYNHNLTELGPVSFKGLLMNTGGKINMSHCSISKIEEAAFEGILPNKVDFSYNKLTAIPPKLLHWNATIADFQGNPLDCGCSQQWLLDKYVPFLYVAKQELLSDLRCDQPEVIRGKRLVHWLNHSSVKSFCDSDILTKDVSTHTKVTMKSSPEMIYVFVFLGVLAIVLVLVGIVLQRKAIIKKTRKNRRF